ncbi:MAG: M48 family metalloprotease [Alphaproteobacteria bacterium]|nr:M48 family metalloprotease [Alphaproteobacteria bacterium]
MRKLFAILFCVLCPIYANAASLINDTEIESVVKEIIAPLATAADISPSRMQVYIVNNDDFNAFVMSGEDVYIYTGLLTRVTSPNALRAVVAHEMGHMIGGHMAQMSAAMEAEMKRTMLIQALGVGLMVAGGNPSLGAGVMAGATSIARQSILSFSRDEERMADDMGLNLMVRAGVNPNGFLDVFNQMNDMMSHIESKINPNAINHPLTSERLKHVRDRLAEPEIKNKKYKSDSDDMVKKYALVRAKLVGYLDNAGRVKTLYPYSDKSDAAIYARAIANMRGGNLDGALVGTRTLVSRSPNNPYFYELMGDIEYAYGHYDDSADAYERALKLKPKSPQIETAFALVLIERNKPGDKERAIEFCKHAILVEETPLAYWTLARAYGESDGRSDWAMAEYYRMQKSPEKSREYAKRAKTKLQKNSPEYIKSDDILNQKK